MADDGERRLLRLDLLEPMTGRLLPSVEAPIVAAPIGGAALLVSGDVAFGKLRPYLAKSTLVREPAYASTELLGIRPSPNLDSRFLAYLVQSKPFIDWTVATSEGTKMPRTSWEKAGAFCMPDLDLAGQQAIADFLDTETARIDSLIAKKRRIIELSAARHRSTLDQIIGRVSNGTAVALGRFVVSLTQGASPQASNIPADGDEYGLLKLSAVKRGRYFPEENKALPQEFAINPDFVLQRGDLLVTRSNTPAYVGDVCVVDREARVVLCDLIYRLRLDSRLDPRFAALALLRSDARFHLSSAARGTSQSMVKLRGEDIKATRIPAPPLEVQRGIVEEASITERMHLRLDECLRRQIELLQEHRRALTTAAVAGGIEVPGVAR